MTTNATVEARHKDEAAQPMNWLASTNAHAQALANLEAARAENADLTNRLAEIDRKGGGPFIATIGRRVDRKISSVGELLRLINGGAKIERIALASGHTPSPCPHCAAKDEAMAAFKADVSENVSAFDKMWGESGQATRIRFLAKFSRFIIPPADPVAEALKAVLQAYQVCPRGRTYDADPDWPAALAELKSRLGGAK